ncbi:TetR family transcriptional regulator [Streptomyces tubbatahanensis]|uniref:TetR family transcriptional regulator n=1 Tax=Streptomyces tubbatahanensis TaxID=2923272 RepID=A0ABY3XZP8_9ACTN|nr:TetR family transcriptional regulator [Streptomyces tubbatahanensis]UNS99816.1 TetR family transcriptional regulator [Streptomyces tubbatahanensis]
MNQQTTTRERILREAERLFVERGYHATALQEVADRVGITKAALYYHFSSKAQILGDLLDPMTNELEQVLTDALDQQGSGGVAAVRGTLVTGWLDVFLRYRNTLVTLLRELPATPSDSFSRLLRTMEYGIEVGAGEGAGISERIAVAQAVSAVTDPVALMPQLSNEVLRDHLLAGVWRLLPESAPGARRARGGRPRTVTEEAAGLARELYASGEHTVDSIAARLGVSRATVYRHLKK